MAELDHSSRLKELVAATLMVNFVGGAYSAGIVLPMILGVAQFQHLFQRACDQFQTNSRRASIAIDRNFTFCFIKQDGDMI